MRLVTRFEFCVAGSGWGDQWSGREKGEARERGSPFSRQVNYKIIELLDDENGPSDRIPVQNKSTKAFGTFS